MRYHAAMPEAMLTPCDNEGCALTLAGTRMRARASGALWMPEGRVLAVSDLHLGKAERNARRGGGFWPPYENEATLARLDAEAAALDPARIVLLGDSFDDGRCAETLAEAERNRLAALAAHRDLIWIAGNHDPAPPGLPGGNAQEIRIGGLVLRHIAEPGATGEISGHYHPKAIVQARARWVRRKCFLADARRVILPAFGHYTGGLDVLDPAFDPLLGADAVAVLTGERALRVPLTRLRQMAA